MSATTVVQKDRLDALRKRRDAARDKKAAARQALAAARKISDADAEGIAQQAYDDAHSDEELVSALEVAALRQIVGGTREFGAALANNPDAQRTLAELAASTAHIQSAIHLGAVLSLEDTLDLTGSALRAAPVVTPDPVGPSGFLGIAPSLTPTPTDLLSLFASVPMGTRRAEFLERTGGIAAAGVQVPGAVKKEASLTYTDRDVEAVTCASWTKLNRVQADDIPGLLQDIRSALQDGVLTVVEQILVGSPAVTGAPSRHPRHVRRDGPRHHRGYDPRGCGEHGACAAAGHRREQQLHRGPPAGLQRGGAQDRQRRAAGRDPLRRAGCGTSRWCRPIALAQGKVLLGNSAGARLGVRQPVSAVASQESDDFTRNRLTVLVEGRWAPIVEVPAYFASFTAP